MRRLIVEEIYWNRQQMVASLVKNGKLKPAQVKKEWAKMVVKDLTTVGAKVPKEVRELLK
jgi:hypothetical protein